MSRIRKIEELVYYFISLRSSILLREYFSKILLGFYKVSIAERLLCTRTNKTEEFEKFKWQTDMSHAIVELYDANYFSCRRNFEIDISYKVSILAAAKGISVLFYLIFVCTYLRGYTTDL